LKLVLFVEIIVLLGSALAISRDNQDSWILEGLEIPFIVFVTTYAITFYFEKRIKPMVALAAVCSSVFALIPNLKYAWFLGRNIDQHIQYSLSSYVLNEGYFMPNQYWTGPIRFYANTPLIHLSFASLSIISNIPILHTFKFLPVLLSSIYPLLTYTIIKKLGFTKEKTVLKYALFISSIPVEPALSYIVTGSMFGVLFSFFILSQIVKILQKNNRSDWLLLIILSVALVTAHSFSSIQLAILVLGVMALQKFSSLRIKSYLKTSAVFLILLLNLGWLMFQATGTLRYIISEIVNMGILRGIYPKTGVIPARFFELAYVNIFEALKTISVYDGAHVFLLLLMIASVLYVVKNRKWSNTLKFLCLFNALLWLLLVVGILSSVGAFYWLRIVRFASISYGVFFGILIVRAHLDKRRMRPVVVSLLLITMGLATIQFYRYQPLVSPANVLSRNLPTDEPIVYVVEVNSIYQREMIRFAEDYVRGRIASDRVTTNQIYGLTSHNFSQTFVIWFYPFSGLLDKTIPEKEYDYFLIHIPGKSGAFEEQAEIRTRDLILNTINNSSIVYTNGESYIVMHNTTRP
jgi:hypothetical protein